MLGSALGRNAAAMWSSVRASATLGTHASPVFPGTVTPFPDGVFSGGGNVSFLLKAGLPLIARLEEPTCNAGDPC